MDELEESVRSALRAAEQPADPEEFLQRVRSGARRRRRRHQLAAATALAAAAAVVGVVLATSLPLQRPAPPPYAARQTIDLPPAGTGAVLSVSAASPERWWVLSSAPCRTFATGCAVVGGTNLDHAVRVPASTPGDTDIPTASTVDEVRFAVDGRDGWLFGGALWATHDGGRTWHRQALPGGTTVESLAAYGDRVYALTIGAHRRVGMLTSPTSSDSWTRQRLPRGISVHGSRLALSRGVQAFAAKTPRVRGIVVSHDGGRTWKLTRSPCGTAALAATGTSLWATCPADSGGAVYTSAEGRSWRRVGAVMLGEGTQLAPLTNRDTLVYLDHRVDLLDQDGAVHQVAVPLRPGEQIRYVGFNDATHGFLVTTSGRLLVSSDAGHSWTQAR